MLLCELSENVCSLLFNEDCLVVFMFVKLNGEGKLSVELSIECIII